MLEPALKQGEGLASKLSLSSYNPLQQWQSLLCSLLAPAFSLTERPKPQNFLQSSHIFSLNVFNNNVTVFLNFLKCVGVHVEMWCHMSIMPDSCHDSVPVKAGWIDASFWLLKHLKWYVFKRAFSYSIPNHSIHTRNPHETETHPRLSLHPFKQVFLLSFL